MAEGLFDNRDKILAAMRALPRRLAQKGAKAAVRKAAKPVLDAARAGALRIDDKGTAEQIAKNIAVQYRSRDSKRQQAVIYSVGVRGGAKQYANTRDNRRKGRTGQKYQTSGNSGNPGGDTWYWRFQELGTSKTRAQPFMQPALASNVERSLQIMADELDTQVTKLAGQL